MESGKGSTRDNPSLPVPSVYHVVREKTRRRLPSRPSQYVLPPM